MNEGPMARWLEAHSFDPNTAHHINCDYAHDQAPYDDMQCATCDRGSGRRMHGMHFKIVSCSRMYRRTCKKCWGAFYERKWSDRLFDCVNMICDEIGIPRKCRSQLNRQTLWKCLGIGFSDDNLINYRSRHLLHKRQANARVDVDGESYKQLTSICDTFRANIAELFPRIPPSIISKKRKAEHELTPDEELLTFERCPDSDACQCFICCVLGA